MDRYVSTKKLMDAVKHGTEAQRASVWKAIEDTPAENVEPIIDATWVYTRADGGLNYWLCSNCHAAYHRKDPHDRKRCYNCGAHMSKEA